MSIVLRCTENGRAGHAVLTVEKDGRAVLVDTINVLRDQARREFLRKVIDLPGVKVDESGIIRQQLLDIASELTPQAERGDQRSEEIKTGRVVRPELFHLAEASGVAVPATVRIFGNDAPRVGGKWFLYTRHHDSGVRERVELGDQLHIDGGEPAWLYPRPADPAPQTAAGWSSTSRREWLDGKPCPDPADVFLRVCRLVAEFIDFPAADAPGHCAVLATWIVLTYCYPAWPAVPYLFFSGPAGSGKSRCFEVLQQLVFRPLGTSSISSAALFRTIHDRGGVLLFDEAEQLKRSNDPGVGELLSMLLAGYKRGGRALRLDKVGDGFQTVAFDVFGPKGVACIAGLPPALSSRCITIPMFRAAADSPKPRRRLTDYAERWQAVRDDLHVVALEQGNVWGELSRRQAVCPAMTGRDYELWQPLLAIGTWLEEHGADGLHGLLVEHAGKSIDAGKDDTVPDTDAILLRALHASIRNYESPTAKDLLERVVEAEPNTFTRWSAKAISTHLGRYGIRTVKTNGRRVYRPEPSDLEKVASVYFDCSRYFR